MKLPHHKADIAVEGFQRLEDLATAYWYSEVLFTALELNIFGLLGEGSAAVAELAQISGYEADGLSRFLAALVGLGLIEEHNGQFANGPLAAHYLIPGTEAYVGDFLLYRRYLTSHWQRLGDRIRQGSVANDRPLDEAPEVFRERTLAYVRTMDLQARIKAAEGVDFLGKMFSTPPARILDVGGGAGAWCRAVRSLWPEVRPVLFDLPETLTAAHYLYPNEKDWEGIDVLAGNILTPCIWGPKFDLVILSNVLHAYGASEAQAILKYCAGCLAPGGMVLIHDYLADLHDTDPVKGALYDLHMLINTYNGRIYRLVELMTMLEGAGLKHVRVWHLRTDTSILLANLEDARALEHITQHEMLSAQAQQLGFANACVIKTAEIAVEPWVRLKCQFGCSNYDQSPGCPPYALDEAKMAATISRYKHALLVQGTPPSKIFHEQLLALEKALFLGGHTEALAFGAGPCPVCSTCVTDGRCRFPEKLRPSLEACGVDVYETARRAGLNLNPVQHHLGYVKYVGLVLFGLKEDYAGPADPGNFNA
jgi:predicted metal-binding protein/2-polyprenyl-3-methyl-5-hydroxy-6-metoxy-1,4-benzoquinol methylase